MPDEDILYLYTVLGIPMNASKAEIKTAYRSLAQKYHPDKNSDPDAKEIMQEIQIAYDTLSDPEKRAQYNLTGDYDQVPQSKVTDAEKIVLEAFAMILKNAANDKVDIIKEVEKMIFNVEDELRDKLIQLMQQLKTCEMSMKRIKSSDDENLWQQVVDAEIRGLKVGRDNLEKEIQNTVDARELLSHYHDSKPGSPNESPRKRLGFGERGGTFHNNTEWWSGP